MIKKAFTMTEALIIIGIIGVIAALSIVAVNTAKPDKDIIMFRRAYSETQKVIRELLTDKELYPKAEVIALNLNSSKLMSMAISRNCNQMYQDYCSYKAEITPPEGFTDDFGNQCGMSNNEYLRYRTNNCGGGGGGGSLSSSSSSSSSSGSSSGLSSGIIPPVVSSSGLSSGRGPILVPQCSILQEEACKEKGTFYYLNDECECVLRQPKSSSSSSGLISSGLASGAVLPKPGIITCNQIFVLNCKAKKGTVNYTTCQCELPNGDELTFEDSQISVLGEGFADTEITDAQKAKNPFLNLAGVGPQNKFAVSFANRLNTVSNPTISNNTVQFGTPDGLYWVIEDHFNDSTKYAYISVHMAKISPTLNDTQLSDALSKTCGYSATCQAPNKFTFKVEPSGRVQLVQPDDKAKVDPMACSYLRYPKINKRSKIPTDHTVNNCFPKPKKPAILPPRRP